MRILGYVSSGIRRGLGVQRWAPFLLDQGHKTPIGADGDRVVFTADVVEGELDRVERSEGGLPSMSAKYSRRFLDYQRRETQQFISLTGIFLEPSQKGLMGLLTKLALPEFAHGCRQEFQSGQFRNLNALTAGVDLSIVSVPGSRW